MSERPLLDVSDLPTHGFGPRATTWWGTLAFCALEGTGFALACGTYLYLAFIGTEKWPLQAEAPDTAPGIIFLVVLLASALPNMWVKAAAKAEDLRKVRIGLIVMCAFGLVLTAIRVFEFQALNIWWDTNAYGSILWFILGLHTSHLLTDLADTFVVTALMLTRHGKTPRRFSDVDDNAFYWYFVVLSWLPFYVLIYWFPRI
jgi:heme/copper-type cytochrome/quinol oxidase subunit 3